MMHYQIGQTFPLDQKRGITGRKLDEPVWHALRVKPQKEMASSGILARQQGVLSFVPTEDRTRHVRGQKIVRTYPTVTQIIYAKFYYAPQWDVMRDRGIITGVFCLGNRPIVLTADTIRILRGLPTRAERLQAAREELLRVNAGDQVRLASGLLEGLVVDVTDSKQGKVWWQVVLGGRQISGETSRDSVAKLGVEAKD